VKPVTLRTERLILDQPVTADRDAIVEYCRDPLFETFMTLPWPYELKHAEYFIDQLVPQGWATGSELTWSIRETDGGPILGALGWRAAGNDVGYWLGAPHRGRGIMTEALTAVTDHLFAELGLAEIRWECVVGNTASASVARKTGFRFTGEAPTELTFRDGSRPLGWHGILTKDRSTEGTAWPA
jgi:RimJ/RimL family protein N-acetyltransferase